jgi:hypothetical protein
MLLLLSLLKTATKGAEVFKLITDGSITRGEGELILDSALSSERGIWNVYIGWFKGHLVSHVSPFLFLR